jgi:dTDP-4-dehydrorhamnose 3,5-epimerase
MSMSVGTTRIAGVKVVQTTPFNDHRGAFQRLYCDRDLSAVVGERQVVQINHSRTAEVGALRGMHFQAAPHAEMKFVRCLRGRVWDVAVDLRAGSPTFLQWHAEELSPDNARMMVIPEGCAHGFQSLEPHSELLYLHTAHYAPSAEGGVRHDDPALGIAWPLPITDVSERDQRHPLISSDFRGLIL